MAERIRRGGQREAPLDRRLEPPRRHFFAQRRRSGGVGGDRRRGAGDPRSDFRAQRKAAGIERRQTQLGFRQFLGPLQPAERETRKRLNAASQPASFVPAESVGAMFERLFIPPGLLADVAQHGVQQRRIAKHAERRTTQRLRRRPIACVEPRLDPRKSLFGSSPAQPQSRLSHPAASFDFGRIAIDCRLETVGNPARLLAASPRRDHPGREPHFNRCRPHPDRSEATARRNAPQRAPVTSTSPTEQRPRRSM